MEGNLSGKRGIPGILHFGIGDSTFEQDTLLD